MINVTFHFYLGRSLTQSTFIDVGGSSAACNRTSILCKGLPSQGLNKDKQFPHSINDDSNLTSKNVNNGNIIRISERANEGIAYENNQYPGSIFCIIFFNVVVYSKKIYNRRKQSRLS